MISPRKIAELEAFWQTDKPIRLLAARWGCSKENISAIAKRRGLPSRRLRSWEVRTAARAARAFTSDSDAYLLAEAKIRGLTVPELKLSLISIISQERLVEAILDDADDIRKAA